MVAIRQVIPYIAHEVKVWRTPLNPEHFCWSMEKKEKKRTSLFSRG